MEDDRRNTKRRKFGYYMRVVDGYTTELVGYLSDISRRGFKLDTRSGHIVNKEFNLRLDLTPDISDRSYITFVACVKWSNPDTLDPGSYIEGFQIVNISAFDEEIFNRILEKYGRPENEW
jgi:PilZ domain